jgi:hypothetical protein
MNFRKELFFPNLFRRQTLQEWVSLGGKLADQVAHERGADTGRGWSCCIATRSGCRDGARLQKAIRFAQARARGLIFAPSMFSNAIGP